MQTLTFQNITLTPAKVDSQIWLSSTDLAKSLGYSQSNAVTKLYNENSDEFTDGMTTIAEVKTKGGLQKTRIFSLRGCHLIAMFARTKVAKEFRQWVLDILDKEVGQPVATPASTLSTKSDRKGLVQAVNRLVNRYKVSYATAWKVVHEYMNVDSVEELTLEQVQTATAYVHLLMLDDTREHQQALYKVLADSAIHLYDYMQIIKTLNRLPIACDDLGRNTFKEIMDNYVNIIDISLRLDLRNQYDKPMFERGRINCYHGSAVTTSQLLTL